MNDYPKNVRRKDRQETNTEFLVNLLRITISCSIAIEKEGFPFIHTTFYAYDEIANELNFHFSKYGYAGRTITTGKKASVSIYRYGKFYTHHKAVDFGCEYQSVILYGNIRIVKEEAERINAMDMFFNKYFHHIPKDDYEGVSVQQTRPIHIAKIKINDWVGKQHRLPDNALHSFQPPVETLI